MKKQNLESFFLIALEYCEKNRPKELERARNTTRSTFENMKAKGFLESYCWVVYASGFKVQVVEQKFPALRKAFKFFSLNDLSRMRSIHPVLKVINNKQKAAGFLNGSKNIHQEGFSNFKNRLDMDGMDVLKELPFIGEITKKHLAKRIGLADVSKDDIWLQRIKKKFNAKNVDELIKHLSQKFKESENVIDVVLWRYCADNGLKDV
jgi:hypothetical protein